MIVEFDHKKSTVTFGGGRFVCYFAKTGLIKKVFEISVFETGINFRPIDPGNPLFVEKVPFDGHKIFSAIRIISAIDLGEASWLPNKYLSKDRDLKAVQDLENIAAQIAFGRITQLLTKKDYEGALLNINASLLSKYLKDNPQYMARFLEKQAEGFTGLDNYSEARKSILGVMKYDKNFNFFYYYSLGFAEYKLGNKKEAIDNFERFAKLANASMESGNENENKKNKELIEMSHKLIDKLEDVYTKG